MLNAQKIIEDLESDIILTNKRKLEDPKLINNTYAQFILVGKISMLEILGYLSEEDAKSYIEMAKGRFAKEICDMYNNKSSDEYLDDLLPLYKKLSIS